MAPADERSGAFTGVNTARDRLGRLDVQLRGALWTIGPRHVVHDLAADELAGERRDTMRVIQTE
jgi:hypothetical protein